ncbi:MULTISPECIES: DEAD/DEAH box helicase [unclassified Curtobacterium]|uniref:DEAD/DEAH box helicase n=1 Tax=unclassified Curtobacterium TaxID=257496 RepID=UPI000DA91DE0|nr:MULTISPECIES: DEAD/DEAH box helicase [unclassified Curtobacterium]PZE24969.1 ATP-dependent helicase [Curtobacterium sp. MCBD17_028]PZE73624.1 ATP-dependent helicase [Curtobacterium sp. MCBD17_019]PZF60639.1 ATP-dependent helicase [Curtobacterium sp. MCBD17_013]WIB64434.1 DEAD/DEAH box helicase [Curtobacterium sp. MCBD17_040]WIE55453.1 DEAD/DEAH box helicase [Curtobacterium sp. MCBD17_003]
MARSGIRRAAGGVRSAPRRTRPVDNEGLIPVLARAVREVEAAAQRGALRPSNRTKFQAVAQLMREERARVKADADLTDAQRAEQLKRLDGVATILAKTAARDTSVIQLLAEDAPVSESTRTVKRDMMIAAGMELAPEELVIAAEPTSPVEAPERAVVPQQVVARQLANPFLPPDFSLAEAPVAHPRRLANWELFGPLFKSFEYGAGGGVASMPLPEPTTLRTPAGAELMKHQAELVASAAQGHRTFLLADEPGLGKTAQSLLAADAANAFPLLVVVPNVVKTNWMREAQRWVPNRSVTVLHGDGEDMDGFADVIVVNYEILDRHVGWLGALGFRGMVVDEAHFIKNKESQRSRFVLQLAERIRERMARPLLMALTGTPLINSVEDFRTIWQFLGWIDDKKPRAELMNALEDIGLTPAEPGFFVEARRAVIEMGIVRRRKVDVAADIPARRIADIPVELDDEVGRSIRDAERELTAKLVARYHQALAARTGQAPVEGIDHKLVRQVARWELEDQDATTTGENVFSMVRRIGRAKAQLAADYAAQLASNVGKVVFFAKHLDVMDQAEEVFARRGLRTATVRGEQSTAQRTAEIDAFVNDPDVAVIVCSLTAAGVGLNLQVASNVVLAELSWTSAEQTQAIDRVHRIGQEEPVTAWRIIAAQTIDTKIAELIDSKAGLAARALDGSDEELVDSGDIQLDAMAAMLTDALEGR